MTPKQAKWRPDESRGTLAKNYRSKTTRRWSEWDGSGPLDVYTLPVLAELMIKGGVSPTTPGGGTNSRLRTYNPTMTADDLESGTFYWGDPNVQVFQAAYCMGDELVISMDTGSTDGVMMSLKGKGRFPSKDDTDSVPSQLNAPLIAAADTEFWFDTSSSIGTTAVNGRVTNCQITIPTGVTYKWRAAGPSAGLNFNAHGRGKRAATMKVTMELLDATQYDIFAGNNGDTVVKARVRFNGPIIEGSLRHYVEFDIYGTFDEPEWGEFETSNRTISFTIESEYSTTAGHDFQLKVQNDRASL